MAKKKHTATGKDGKVVKRTTASGRLYTHAVIVYFNAWTGADGTEHPAYTKTEWAGNLRNAQLGEKRWLRVKHSHPTRVLDVEIVEATHD